MAQKKTKTNVKAIVQNRGQGEASNVKAEVVVNNPNLIFIGKHSFHFGDMGPGEWKKFAF